MKTAFLQTPVHPKLLAAFWSFAKQQDLSPSVALRRTVAHVLSCAGYPIDDYDPDRERTNDHVQWARRRRPQIAIDGANPVLIARMTPGMKAAFEQYATAHDRTSSDTLHALVQHVVRSAGIETGDLTPPKPPPLRAERLTVRLCTEEMAAARTMAQEFGSVREWAVACLQDRLRPGRLRLTANEVKALYASNRELWSVSHNVNQIARAVNLDMKQTGRLEGSAARVQELDHLKAVIKEHTTHVMALCNASSARWAAG